jgi:hypothetical protein
MNAVVAPASCRLSRGRLSPSVAGEPWRAVEIVLTPPGRGVRAYVGNASAGVDVEAEDRVYFYRLVAAKYRAKLPAG